MKKKYNEEFIVKTIAFITKLALIPPNATDEMRDERIEELLKFFDLTWSDFRRISPLSTKVIEFITRKNEAQRIAAKAITQTNNNNN